MQKSALFSSWWSESTDLQTEILARLPVEFVYRYRTISKQWKYFLSSSYFLTKWADAPLNGKQPRLLLCGKNPTRSSASFCFATRTWIKSFTFSFLEDWLRNPYRPIHLDMYCRGSVGGLILVHGVDCHNKWSLRLCNPYTRAFVDIPMPKTGIEHAECIVLNENNNQKSGCAYKVVSVGYYRVEENDVPETQKVAIYESSQKEWKSAGYFPEDIMLGPYSQLVFHNGLFWTQSEMAVEKTKGIVCFTIPVEQNGSEAIPLNFVPFPEKVKDRNDYSSPWMVTCGSRLLLVEAKYRSVRSPQRRRRRSRKFKLTVTLWEFINEDSLSNSPSWKWVEIAQMPSLLCDEWMNTLSPLEEMIFPRECCIGVGDYVCFVPAISEHPVEVVCYNVVDNSWNRLPPCDSSFDGGFYTTIAFLPSPHRNVE